MKHDAWPSVTANIRRIKLANAPLKKCAEPGCRQLIRGSARCEQHSNRPRTTPTDPFYASTAWRNLRDRFIQANPLCKPCEDAGRTTPSFIADHILERKDRPDLELC